MGAGLSDSNHAVAMEAIVLCCLNDTSGNFSPDYNSNYGTFVHSPEATARVDGEQLLSELDPLLTNAEMRMVFVRDLVELCKNYPYRYEVALENLKVWSIEHRREVFKLVRDGATRKQIHLHPSLKRLFVEYTSL